MPRSGLLRCAAALAALAAAVAMPAAAATATTTFQVTLAVQATCTISATAMAFGSYAAVQIDATSTITATCTNTTAYNIIMDGGVHSGGSYLWNLIGPSSALLAYKVFRDAGRTQPWGGTAGYDSVGGTGNGTAQTITVYGRLPAGQLSTPGGYTDTLTATLVY